VIARIWRGTTKADRAEEYLDYIRATGVSEYQATPGFRGVQILTRTREGLTRITVISFWDSMDAVKAFAGDDPEVAHYYPEDDEFLVEKEETVEHHDVAFLPSPHPGVG
jgi:heme-degrading monooxygenase HmoA